MSKRHGTCKKHNLVLISLIDMKYGIELSDCQLISMLSDFYQDPNFEELKRLYLTRSFPEILSVARREMSHSSFLAWLFNMNESHGMGAFPILQFLKILVQRDLQQNSSRHERKYSWRTSTEKLAIAITNEDIVVKEMITSLEKSAYAGNTRGRMDILIDAKIIIDNKERDLHVIIENKVYSDEHGNQTNTYFKSKDDELCKSRNSSFLFVYLTPLHRKELDALTEPECSNKEYIQINYQDILDNILEPALRKDISMRTRFVIEEYIHCLNLPALSIDSKENNYNPNTIMATNKRTTEMLKAFWEKNEPLLMAALNSLVETSDDVDIQEKLAPAIDALAVNKRREKDKTHYVFDGKQANGKYALVSIVIAEAMNNDITPEDCSKNFIDSFKSFGGKSNSCIYNTLQEKLKKNNTEMTCPSPEELYNVQKFSSGWKDRQMVYDESAYENWWKTQGKKKEIYKKEGKYRIFNQWGYDTIDFFIYAFYDNREKWNLGDKDIQVIKQISL